MYTRTLHTKLQRLRKGTSTVDEYFKEMEIVMIRTGVLVHQFKEATIYGPLLAIWQFAIINSSSRMS